MNGCFIFAGVIKFVVGHQKAKLGDFPGSPVVKNLPSNAGDVGSIPGQGTKIPHAAGQRNPLATTIELARLN